MKRHFYGFDAFIAYVAERGGVQHVTVLHDDACWPTRCVCRPEYVVEDATTENVADGARRQAAWIRSKAS